jgi:hypothetical protein
MRIRDVAAALRRVASDDNLDLYALSGAAFVFTVLGVAGIADTRLLSSIILALLAVLAVSQVRTRNHLTGAVPGGGVPLLEDWPHEISEQRQTASDVLYIGVSMARTVRTERETLRRLLQRGGRLRVLLVDPGAVEAVRAAGSRYAGHPDPGQLREWIEGSLSSLEYLRKNTGGDLQLRVTSSMPHVGIQAVDARTSAGLLLVQHYEHRPSGEPGPMLLFHARDGFWYQHFAAEAERIWEDGSPWPRTDLRPAGMRAATLTEDFDGALIRRIIDSDRLFVTGVARNALLVDHFEAFEAQLRAGGSLRVLLLDPEATDAVSVAAERYYVQRSPTTLAERIRQSLSFLAELSEDGCDLEVRLTRQPFAMGMLGVGCDPLSPAGDDTSLFLEYYTYQGPRMPKLVLDGSEPRWRDLFLGEAQALWHGAAVCDLDALRRR